MVKRSRLVFIGLHIIAWIIFIGLCVEAGGLIVNFIFTMFKPEVLPNLYQKLDLSEMYNSSKWAFFGIYSFILVISVLKAMMFYVVIMLLLRFDWSKPFSSYVADQISKISYYTLSIGLLSYAARQTARSLQHYGFEINTLNQFWADSRAFVLMAAIIYVIASIFSRGVEIQKENDLTI